MLPFINQVNLIRYLVVWRVNASLVQLPRCLSVELSRRLGTVIANRLPTQAARRWRKALSAWDSAPDGPTGRAIPETGWPVEAVLFAYPGKRTCGQGEAILWELKLLGPSADHSLFLEFILPAMEELAVSPDAAKQRSKEVWGHFDIQAIYAARGRRWEPLVSDGRLNLAYCPTATQWAEGLAFGQGERRRFRRIRWLTPFDLGEAGAPTLQTVLDALASRMTMFLPGKRPTPDDVWALVTPEEQTSLQLALQETRPVTQPSPALNPAPKDWPGRRIGVHSFSLIPASVVPYLELASILHVGRYTHFGCGTFRLE